MLLFFAQVFILAASFILSSYIILDNISISTNILIVISISWLLSIFFTHKHKPKYYQLKFKYVLAPYPKSIFIQLLLILLSYLIQIIRDQGLSILLICIAFYAFIEVILLKILFRLKIKRGQIKTKGSVKKYEQEDLEFDCANINVQQTEELDNIFENNSKEKAKQLTQIINAKSTLTLSDSILSLKDRRYENENRTDYSLVILHTNLNDLYKINQHIRNCYKFLKPGGYLIVKYRNIDQTNKRLKSKFGFLKAFIFPLHWLFYRVLSKIRATSKFQEWISRGRNKVLSWIEVWGRLAYSGLDVIKEIKEEKQNIILAQKTKTLSQNPSPSFHILIKLNRVSLYGNIIKINKVRSMFPYSEFLQKRIFEENQMGNTGKAQDDPRITPQGKIFRKFWIDELPQFLDWLRGEIKFVGIRALSQHYFSLYNPEYQDKFKQVKPGIFSPIFDEETDSFEDIQKIELTYLNKYLKSPTKTDWAYFWITIKHMFSGVRSK